MLKSWSCLICSWIALWLVGSTQAILPVRTLGNSIGEPGQPLYYLMADTGSSVGPNDELKRTNRSLMKWWDDLFGQNNCNNCNNNLLYNNLAPGFPYNNNNNNCNGFQLQSLDSLDPFKQIKLFKKLPDLWGNNCAQCNQCGGQQPINTNFGPITDPAYGGDSYAPIPQQQPAGPVDYGQAPAAPSSVGGYETPNKAYDGPGDGDAGYVAPAAPQPAPAPDSYAAAPDAPEYEAPAPAAPPASNYEAPAPTPAYEPQAPAPAPESYSKVEEYAQPANSYGGGAQQQQQQPQIVYQPIIYLSAPPAVKEEPKQTEQSYEAAPQQPAYEQPPQIDLPTYAPAPTPAPAPAPAPPAPCNAPACAGYLPILGMPLYGYPTPQALAPPASAPAYYQPAPQQAPVYSAPPAPVYAQPPPAPVYAAPQAPVYAAPPAPPAPVYATPPAPPAPVYAAPPAPANSSPCCQTPLRLSLVDQPYRVAPELFQEYHYRLSLADQRPL